MSDQVVEKYLDKYRHLPQSQKENHGGRLVKFRWCKLCGKKLEAKDEFRRHMARHW